MRMCAFGYTVEQFNSISDRPFNAELFTERELEVLAKVAATFKHTSTGDIVALSRLEEAWKQNIQDKSAISYAYAYELNPV